MLSDAGRNRKFIKPYDQGIKIGSGEDCGKCPSLLRAFKFKL